MPKHSSSTDHITHNIVVGESSPKEYIKFAGVIAVIICVAWLLNIYVGDGSPMDYMRWFMGVFFVVFASFKLVGYSMFAMMFAGYDVIARRFKPYAYAYPFIELGLGFLYLLNLVPVVRDVAVVIILGIGSIGVFQELRRRSGIHCACLGNVIKLPLSTVSFIEDVGMGLMAALMLVLR